MNESTKPCSQLNPANNVIRLKDFVPYNLHSFGRLDSLLVLRRSTGRNLPPQTHSRWEWNTTTGTPDNGSQKNIIHRLSLVHSKLIYVNISTKTIPLELPLAETLFSTNPGYPTFTSRAFLAPVAHHAPTRTLIATTEQGFDDSSIQPLHVPAATGMCSRASFTNLSRLVMRLFRRSFKL